MSQSVNDLRRAFIQYFEQQGHRAVPSIPPPLPSAQPALPSRHTALLTAQPALPSRQTALSGAPVRNP